MRVRFKQQFNMFIHFEFSQHRFTHYYGVMWQHILAELGLSESNYDCTLTELMCLMLQFKIAARKFSRTIEMKAVYSASSVPMHRVIISVRRYIKTTQLIFSVKANNRLWLIRCGCEGGCFTVIQLIFPQTAFRDNKWLYFRMTSAQERWCYFSSAQGKHLAVRWRLASSRLTPGIPHHGLCQPKSPS